MRGLSLFFPFISHHRFSPMDSEIYCPVYSYSQAASSSDIYTGVMGPEAKWDTLETFTQEDEKGNFCLGCANIVHAV